MPPTTSTTASLFGDAAPTEPPTPGLPQHPQANRRTRLGGVVLAYHLQRVRRRSVGLVVDAQGLRVRAPQAATLAAIEAVLQEKSPWILRKLREQQLRQHQEASARITWADGATLPYLGAPLSLHINPALPTHSALISAMAGQGEAQLHLRLAQNAQGAQLRDAAQAWFMRQALVHFQERLQHFAPLVGVRWTRLRLSNARTRWGTAQSNGSIALNWRLLHYSPAIIDYVVVHELSHLRVMDHSPQFWNTVAEVMPNYPQRRAALRQHQNLPWD